MPEVCTIVIHPTVKVVIEREGNSWGAYAPSIPGCGATGRSRGVVERRITEALDIYFEEMHKIGVKEIAEELAIEAVQRS